MSTCVVCSNECVDGSDVKCAGGCGRMIHVNCVKSDGKKQLRSNKDWKCSECKNVSSGNSSVPSGSTSANTVTKDFIVNVLEAFKKEVFGEFKLFKNDMLELSKSTQFISDKLDTSNLLMEELKNQFAELKKENLDLKMKNETLSQEMIEMRERMRELEQYSRRNNIEISGLPVTPKENVADIVRDLGAAIGVTVKEEDVAAAHRVPSYNKDREPSLVVQFSSRATRNTWIDNYRRVKMLSAQKVNRVFPDRRIFINEHLSPENKQFLAKLKKKSRDAGYTFVWSREGRFFVRKGEGDSVKRITSYADIESLK